MLGGSVCDFQNAFFNIVFSGWLIGIFTPLYDSQHCSANWLGPSGNKPLTPGITWANVHPDLSRYIALLAEWVNRSHLKDEFNVSISIKRSLVFLRRSPTNNFQQWFRQWLGAKALLSLQNLSPTPRNLCIFWRLYFSLDWISTHWGPVTIDLGQHWLKGMACCPMAPSHCLKQYWLLISEVLWHSPESNFTCTQGIIMYNKICQLYFQNYFHISQRPLS